MNMVSDGELVGKVIVTQDGREIGKISGLCIDPQQWTVPAISVKLRKDVLETLELKRPLLGTQEVQISTDQIAGVTDSVVLKSRLSEVVLASGERLPPEPALQGE